LIAHIVQNSGRSLYIPLYFSGSLFLSGTYSSLVCLLAGYMAWGVAMDYASIQTAQSSLLNIIAEKSKSGQIYAGSYVKRLKVYADSSYLDKFNELDSMLVAENKQDYFNIYLESLGIRRDLATVYHGRIERQSNGDLQVVRAGGRKINLRYRVAWEAANNRKDVLSEEVKNVLGEEVLAVVPINATEASTIYPVRTAELP
jgi:hypothetical protein